MTGQDIIKNIRHHRVEAGRITDKGLNFVCHCSDEISESSSDNFFLPYRFFLGVQFNGYIFVSRLVDIDIPPFELVVLL